MARALANWASVRLKKAACPLFSVLLGIDLTQIGEQNEEENIWEQHMKEQRHRKDRRHSEQQEALERERRGLEKLDQEWVMMICATGLSVLVSPWYTFSKYLALGEVSPYVSGSHRSDR